MPTAQCTQPIAQLYPQPQPSTSAHNLVQRHTLHYHWRYVLYARVSYKLYLCATSIVIYSFSYVYSGLIQTLGQQHSPFFFSRIQAVLSNFLNFFLNKPNHEKFTIVKVLIQGNMTIWQGNVMSPFAIFMLHLFTAKINWYKLKSCAGHIVPHQHWKVGRWFWTFFVESL